MAGVSVNTVVKLLWDAGNTCAEFHDRHVRGITEERTIQRDEMWSFVYAKQKNVAEAKAAPSVAGNVWTWIGIDAESELIVSYLLSGGRDAESAIGFMLDLGRRLTRTPIVITDALPSYVEAAQWVFGQKAKHVMSKSGTSYVERQNLTMRMGMRRFIRKTPRPLPLVPVPSTAGRSFPKLFEADLNRMALQPERFTRAPWYLDRCLGRRQQRAGGRMRRPASAAALRAVSMAQARRFGSAPTASMTRSAWRAAMPTQPSGR